MIDYRRIETAEIDRERQIAIAIETRERRRFAVQPTLDTSTRNEMRIGGTVIGAAALVFFRSPAKLGVCHDQRRIPAIQFAECGFECGDAIGHVLQ